MKFGRLIEYNIRIVFLKTLHTKYGENSPRRFFKNQNLKNQQSEDLYSLFLFYVQVVDYQNILKLRSFYFI